jgi:regulator of cell morphogenesis and NO signaling
MEVDVHVSDLAELTLNEIVKANPATLAVFTKYGMDTCCGGALPLRDAAARHNIALEQLLNDLDQETAPPAA